MGIIKKFFNWLTSMRVFNRARVVSAVAIVGLLFIGATGLWFAKDIGIFMLTSMQKTIIRLLEEETEEFKKEAEELKEKAEAQAEELKEKAEAQKEKLEKEKKRLKRILKNPQKKLGF